MLDFHLGIGGIENPGKHLGGLNMDEMFWLQKNGFIIEGKTGHLPDSVESLPYFDDVVLSPDQVNDIYNRLIDRLKAVEETSGFKSKAVKKIIEIFRIASDSQEGLSTIAD